MATIRKRGNRWQVQVRRKNLEPHAKSFIHRKDAEAWARQTELELDRTPINHDRRRLERVTLGELVARYRDLITPHKRSAKGETLVLNAFLRHSICLKKLSDLKPNDFCLYRDERLLEVKPRSLKRMLCPIQNLFEVARKDWGLPIVQNPISSLKIVCESDRRERRLWPGELAILEQAAQKTLNPIILPLIHFAIETALRRSEMLQAVWSHVDIEKRLLSVPRAKNGHPRAIPLTRRAIDILEKLKTHQFNTQNKQADLSGPVFPTTAIAVRLAWDRLTRRAGIEDLHFHDLRHEAISRLFEFGLTMPEVASISGHRDPRMLFRYSHSQTMRIIDQLDAANYSTYQSTEIKDSL
jgi:integrase